MAGTPQTIEVELVDSNSQLANRSTRANDYVQTPEMLFRSWVNDQFASDNPDFPLAILSPNLGNKFTGKEIEFAIIAGMSFPVVKGITAAEESFVEWMETKISNNQTRITSLINGVAKRLRAFDDGCNHSVTSYVALVDQKLDKDKKEKDRLWKKGENLTCTIVTHDEFPGIESEIWRNSKNLVIDQATIEIGVDTEEEGAVVDSKKLSVTGSKQLTYMVLNQRCGDLYDIFSDMESEVIGAIMKIANSTVSEKFQNLLRAAFMICHRVDPNWRMSDTFLLLAKDAEAIMKFWAKEKNGGVDPKPPELDPTPKTEAEELAEEAELAIAGQKKDPASPG